VHNFQAQNTFKDQGDWLLTFSLNNKDSMEFPRHIPTSDRVEFSYLKDGPHWSLVPRGRILCGGPIFISIIVSLLWSKVLLDLVTDILDETNFSP